MVFEYTSDAHAIAIMDCRRVGVRVSGGEAEVMPNGGRVAILLPRGRHRVEVSVVDAFGGGDAGQSAAVVR
jgi:hypothetical protein